ncbi:hypothetical protein R1sor_020986 [Riccia sorocarpa]|uniref:DUF7812 domain-containing protein n=1 Tax=Riccia sorocarpa TaxID=122646 RepID=A0ABD3GFR1_9MARC
METPDQSHGTRYSDPNHDYLQSCITDFALLDMVSKAQLLQSLYSYISSVAATMSIMEDSSLGALVGNTTVRLNCAEVIQLHNLLTDELQYHTDFLTKPAFTQSQLERCKFDEIISRNLCLEVITRTLRCCIRILPLVDCFDTSASFRGAGFLVRLMQQLCSPGTLLDILNRSLNGSRCRGKQEIPPVSSSQPVQGSMKMDDGPDNSDSLSDGDSFDAAGELQPRMEAFLGILEVFIDEILLFPHFAARFLDDRENVMSSFSGFTGAALEAAFMHALLSGFSKMRLKESRGRAGEESGVLNLSLPAGLVLLESFTSENVPQTYMSHIIQLVTRVLNSTCMRIEEVDVITSQATSDDCSCWPGGVDWSYCLRKLSVKHDPLDYWVHKGRSLPSVSTVHFVLSIFEHSMLLYKRLSTSCNFSTVEGNNSLAADNLFLKICVSKYSTLRDMSWRESVVEMEGSPGGREYLSTFLRELEEVMFEIMFEGSNAFSSGTAKGCKCQDSGANHSCEEEERSSGGRTSTLVSAILQLGISSLECIAGEIETMKQLPSDVSLQLPNGESVSAAIAEGDVDSIFASLSFSISSFLPGEKQAPANQEPSSKVDGYSLKSPGNLISSIGRAILYFANIFCGEVLAGAPQQLLEDYFRLLESFVALLLVIDGSKRLPCCEKNSSARKESKVAVEDSYLKTLQLSGSGASTWLGAMVLRLESLLHELTLQQRRLPDFFLNFLLEQISRGNAFNLVAVALSRCFETTAVARDRHQSVSSGSFHSRGLVNQILEVALQEPNRHSSLLSLISYINNALEDLLPITGTLSLQEVSETVLCYEHIASVFTVACEFAVSAHSVVTADDMDYRSWLFSTLCEGIQRLFTEGISVAEQISILVVQETIPAVSTDTKIQALLSSSIKVEGSGNAADYEGTWLHCCCSFLVQIEKLRRAVDATHDAADWFLKSNTGYALVSSRSRTFLEAVSKINTKRDHPGCLRQFFIHLQGHFHAVWPVPDLHQSFMHTAKDSATAKHHENDQASFDSDWSQHFQGTSVRAIGSESNELSGRCVRKLDNSVGTLPSGTGTLQQGLEPTVGISVGSKMDLDGVPEAEVVPHIPSSRPTVGSVEPSSTELKRGGCSSTTLAIVKRLTDVRQLPYRKVKQSIRCPSERYLEGLDIIPLMSRDPGKEGRNIKQARNTNDVPAITAVASHPYIETVREVGDESVDDLLDFIVCKKGRNYAAWLKNRRCIRRRIYARTVFKRLQQKRDLQVLLDLFV